MAPLSDFLLDSDVPANFDDLSDEGLNAHIDKCSRILQTRFRRDADVQIRRPSTIRCRRAKWVSIPSIWIGFQLTIEGAKEDNSVVDPELKVYGISNLRICDASIFPDSLSGHPVSTVSVLR